MHRRRYLLGVGTGVGPFVLRVRRRKAPRDVTVSIRETNDPVEAGDPLEGTIVVENAGSEPVRPEVDVLIGGSRQFSWTGTVDPGTAETFDVYHPTFPVRRDVEFPIRAESEYGSAERLVEVFGIDELEDARVIPAHREVAVQPGTTVFFEADGWGQWWSGGNQVFDGLGAIWECQYVEETGAFYWREAFEQPDEHDVVAVLEGEEGNRRATWSVEVTPEGAGAPTIDAVRPHGGSTEAPRGETATFVLEVSAAEAELYRAVWWLGHADRLLEVTDLSGPEATVSLSIDADARCQGCPLIAWVIDENGALAENVWTVSPSTRPDSRWRPRDGPRTRPPRSSG